MYSRELDPDAKMLRTKGMEVLLIALLDVIITLGFFISSRFLEIPYVRSFITIGFTLLGILIFFAVRYYYYYKTGKYEVIEGICIDVNCNIFSKTLRSDCVVLIKTRDERIYRFRSQYKRMFFVIGKKIRLIVPKGIRSHSKEGHIFLDEVLVKKAYDRGL